MSVTRCIILGAGWLEIGIVLACITSCIALSDEGLSYNEECGKIVLYIESVTLLLYFSYQHYSYWQKGSYRK